MEIIILIIPVLFLFFAIFLQIYSRFFFLPRANKIAELVAKKNYTEAIKIGESIKKLNSAERFNLVVAYYASGNVDKAKMLVKELEPKFFLPKIFNEQIKSWSDKLK